MNRYPMKATIDGQIVRSLRLTTDDETTTVWGWDREAGAGVELLTTSTPPERVGTTTSWKVGEITLDEQRGLDQPPDVHLDAARATFGRRQGMSPDADVRAGGAPGRRARERDSTYLLGAAATARSWPRLVNPRHDLREPAPRTISARLTADRHPKFAELAVCPGASRCGSVQRWPWPPTATCPGTRS